ncbi:MAG: DUF885 domain-containing protein [Blastomonas sp.]
MRKSLIFAALLGAATMTAGCDMKADISDDSATGADDGTEWGGFVDGYLSGYFPLHPTFAVYQGRHEFDGQLPDWSEAGLNAQIEYLKSSIADARAIDPKTLTDEQLFERNYLIAVAEGELFWLEDADQPHHNPAFYTGALDPSPYITRPYADAETRMRAFIKYAGNVPAAVGQIKANLKTPLDPALIQYGINAFNGYGEFFVGDAKAAFAEVKDSALQAEFDNVSSAASKAMKELAAWLESEKANAKPGYALGADRFARMLQKTEMVDIPLDELEAIGRADLKRNQEAMKAACAKYAPGASIPDCVAKMGSDKPEGGPVAEARRQLPELRAFLVAKDLVSIPGTEEALVEESPPYNRQNSAYIDIPGPYEKGLPSVYYISPPDPSWPEDVQRDFVPGKKDLLGTSVHEVWPGHFLNFLHANRSDSMFGRLFVGYAFAEGWAHYTEEMMWDAGLNEGDPETHIGQLTNALLRDCRFLSAIGLHARGMTVDQSRQMFRDECYIDEGNARQQALRGTYDPAYLNYTMGKLMIRKLRADWTADKGGREAWKAFHDEFLSYGGPPIPLVRAAMMKEGSPRSVF